MHPVAVGGSGAGTSAASRPRAPAPSAAAAAGVADTLTTARPTTGVRSRSAGPTVLFVCVHNAGRSQLAAGLAAHRAGQSVEVLSAGTDPDEQVDAVTLSSLAELGIDRSDQVPTRLTEDLLDRADVVVTLKPGLALPHRPYVRHENWPLPDPQGWDVDGIRPLRDHLESRVARLLAELDGREPDGTDRPTTPPAPPPPPATRLTALDEETP